MTMIGGEYRFAASAVVCLTGADADHACVINGDREDRLLQRCPTVIPKGSTIRVGRLSNGARGYLCVASGIQSPLVLGSRSALVSLPDAGLGRALRSGDRLAVDDLAATRSIQNGTSNTLDPGLSCSGPRRLRIVPGAHFDRFTKLQQVTLGELDFQVSDQSNRAGVRLSACRISGPLPKILSSEGALAGYVQLPPSGEPIILGVDGPTTGGYPVLACVIAADLSVLAQCEIREQIHFQWVSREEAVKVFQDQHDTLQKIAPLRPIELP